MNLDPSHLFDKQGYLPLREYIADIDMMRARGPWKLPLRTGDKLHYYVLSLMSRFSWFSGSLHIEHPHYASPSYMIILNFLKRTGFYDELRIKVPLISGYYSYFLKKDIVLSGRSWELTGQGAAKDKATALSKAIGEMVERVVTSTEDQNTNILRYSPDELDGGKSTYYYPPRFHRYLDVQRQAFEELNVDTSQQLDWVTGHDMSTNVKVLIPRQLTSWFEAARTRRSLLQHPTSSGCAGFFTKEGAELRALLEVVQRDGILVHWLTKIAPRNVDVGTLPKETQKTIETLSARGIKTYVLDVTSLKIPTACIIAVNEQAEEPMAVMSASSATTFLEAVQGAIDEMPICTGMFNYSPPADTLRSTHVPFLSDIDKTGRQLYWRGHEQLKKFAWFLSGEKITLAKAQEHDIKTGLDDISRLRSCIAILTSQGSDYRPLVYHPKNPTSSALGFFVAQVFIPKAFPLYLVEKYGTFDSDRLQDFATAKGVSTWRMNTEPHPLT